MYVNAFYQKEFFFQFQLYNCGTPPLIPLSLFLSFSLSICLFPLTLQSPQCTLEVPEIGLECTPSTLGGSFTTVEGLLTQIYDQVRVSGRYIERKKERKGARRKGCMQKKRAIHKFLLHFSFLVLNRPLGDLHSWHQTLLLTVTIPLRASRTRWKRF